MIGTYSEYIRRFVLKRGLSGNKCPGEHHFVSVFLVPVLHSISGLVPDYVNPDGTKKLIGDIIYFKEGAHHCGVEVKFGTVRLTKAEFNNWIVSGRADLSPNVFIGISGSGVLLLSWNDFRQSYVQAVQAYSPGWQPKDIEDGYGPTKSVDVLCALRASTGFFRYTEDSAEAELQQANFQSALGRMIW